MKRRKLLVASLIFLGCVGVVGLARNVLAGDRSLLVGHSPNSVDLSRRLAPPGAENWLGTDELGRDLLARMIHGSAVSLSVGFTAAAIALLLGSLLGALAGFYGGGVDWVISRLVEVILCFPFLFLVLAIVAFFPQSLLTLILALGLTSWTAEARLVRAEFLRLKERDFSEAARASGARDSRIILRHLLPNALAPVIALAAFGVGSAILVESALSFLGLGVPLPQASWGSILSSASNYMGHAWWMVLFPGLAIFLTVAACNIVGDALRDAFDPATRSRPADAP
jgi:peptide/nickel transport system permease protein